LSCRYFLFICIFLLVVLTLDSSPLTWLKGLEFWTFNELPTYFSFNIETIYQTYCNFTRFLKQIHEKSVVRLGEYNIMLMSSYKRFKSKWIFRIPNPWFSNSQACLQKFRWAHQRPSWFWSFHGRSHPQYHQSWDSIWRCSFLHIHNGPQQPWVVP